jgi:hypothetical protein
LSKPTPAIVKKASHFMKHPEDATKADIRSMAARLMDDKKRPRTSQTDEKSEEIACSRNDRMIQRLFWQEMTTLKRDARYVDLCLARTYQPGLAVPALFAY